MWRETWISRPPLEKRFGSSEGTPGAPARSTWGVSTAVVKARVRFPVEFLAVSATLLPGALLLNPGRTESARTRDLVPCLRAGEPS